MPIPTLTHKNRAGTPEPVDIPAELVGEISRNAETLFRPEVQASLPPALLTSLHQLVSEGVMVVFLLSMAMAVVTAFLCFMLPKKSNFKSD